MRMGVGRLFARNVVNVDVGFFPRTSETWEQFPSLKTIVVIVFRKKAPQPPTPHIPGKEEEEEMITDSSTM